MTEDTEVQIESLLKNIRDQFYTQTTDKKFFQERTVLLLAITWPAQWLKERGVTWTAERYFQTIRDLLQEIKRHGATGQIKSFAGYLLYSVQDHFRHQSDLYCGEGKAMRSAWELAIGRAVNSTKLAQVREAEALVDEVAEAHRVLAIGRPKPKAKKPAKTDDHQHELF